MLSRIARLSLACLLTTAGLFVPVVSYAQQPDPTLVQVANDTGILASASLVALRETPQVAKPHIPFPQLSFKGAERPKSLVPLYVTTAVLQALDAHSTYEALNTGRAREANPALTAIVGNPAALVAMKTGIAVATIFGAEKIWKQNPVGAVVAMFAINSAYALIVAHNYEVARRGR